MYKKVGKQIGSKKTKKTKKKKNNIRKMSYDELKETKIRYQAENNLDAALRCLERMKPICNDLAELHDTLLEYADLLLQTNDLEKACTMYTEFTKLYPGSKKTEYAYHQAIVCSFKQVRDAERDQSKTKETIELALSFLERATVFTQYASAVGKILAQSRERLFESDSSIFNFYLSRGNLRSASKHLEIMKKEFATSVTQAEPKIIQMEMRFAQAQNNTRLFQEKQTELAQKFPTFSLTLAQTTKPKRSMMNRF
jgi:outer membrane assembly lipoprotein YfiO